MNPKDPIRADIWRHNRIVHRIDEGNAIARIARKGATMDGMPGIVIGERRTPFVAVEQSARPRH